MVNDSEYLEIVSRISSLIDYNPETGSMIWLKKESGRDWKRWNSCRAGRECGTITPMGYRKIFFRPESGITFRIYCHRIVWFMFYGKLPDGVIDHINQDKSDNRISNLRDVPHRINMQNQKRRSTNTSGFMGVSWNKACKKWHASACILGKHHYLGLFDDLDEANRVIVDFRIKNGFSELHGISTDLVDKQ